MFPAPSFIRIQFMLYHEYKTFMLYQHFWFFFKKNILFWLKNRTIYMNAALLSVSFINFAVHTFGVECFLLQISLESNSCYIISTFLYFFKKHIILAEKSNCFHECSTLVVKGIIQNRNLTF